MQHLYFVFKIYKHAQVCRGVSVGYKEPFLALK